MVPGYQAFNFRKYQTLRSILLEATLRGAETFEPQTWPVASIVVLARQLALTEAGDRFDTICSIESPACSDLAERTM